MKPGGSYRSLKNSVTILALKDARNLKVDLHGESVSVIIESFILSRMTNF